jgi:SRSO17 transposase
LEECKLAPQVFDNVLPRLEKFMEPFVERFVRSEQVGHANTFVQGLLSDLKDKNVESIAYRFGQHRMPLQWFVGVSDWDHEPLQAELVQQVADTLGDEDGVLVFDPSGFPKSGRQSVGVARQWCGRLGKVDNCQVAVYLGYVSRHEHALVDTRLYLPKDWTTDKKRCQKAGVPKGTRYRTRHQLCLEMLKKHGSVLPHSWLAGDDEMARVAKAEHRIEECIQRGKSEAGLSDYEVRNWKGWHHHQILSLIASWFLVTEALRGEKMDRRVNRPASSSRDLSDPAACEQMRYQVAYPTRARTAARTQRTCSPLSLEAA